MDEDLTPSTTTSTTEPGIVTTTTPGTPPAATPADAVQGTSRFTG